MTELSERSKQVRRDAYFLSKKNGGYHYGGSFSCIEILIALYDYVLTQEDKFILSKGHSCWGLYALLRERGFNPALGGHPTLDEANGISFTTGSEGHGFPAAVGMALARKIQGKPGRIFVLMGDGECQEGTTWESLLTASHHQLDNLTVIIDWNKFQGAGAVHEILPVGEILEVAMLLNWAAQHVDGHNLELLKIALSVNMIDRPVFIQAHTIKGRGVSFMEGKGEWHAKFPNSDEEKILLEDLQ